MKRFIKHIVFISLIFSIHVVCKAQINYATPSSAIPNITKVEYYIDFDPGLGNATNHPITPGTNLSDIMINIDPATLSPGIHILGIRGQDANGAWSLDNKWIFFKPSGFSNIIPNITKVEYYIDFDPGLGNATNYAVTPGTNLADFILELDPALISHGVHILGIRAQDAKGAWSLDNKLMFFKPFGTGGNIDPPSLIPDIVQVEYFINSDPGLGNGFQIAIAPDTDLRDLIINADVTGLPVGNHNIGVRAKDANGAWSLVNRWNFVIPQITVAPSVLNFGLKAIHSSTTLDVVLNNNGLPGQSINSVVLNSPFSTTYAPGAIPTNGTVTIPVTFNPTALLAYQDTIYINTTNGIYKVALSGSAQPENPQWNTNPITHNYGNRVIGSTTTKYFTITNSGNIPLTVGSFSSTHPAFVVMMPVTNIPVGQTVFAQVDFSPTTITSYSEIIKLVNTANTSDTIFIPVSGMGYLPATAPVLNFPSSAPYNNNSGVFPAVGNAGIYSYSVTYSSASNLPPAADYPKVGIDINADGDFIDPGEGVYSMSKIGTTRNWSVGETFLFNTNLNLGSNYRYKFFANDSLGNIATTAKVSLNNGPFVTTEVLDLRIFADDITFSIQNPAVGQNFNVTAVIHNNSPYSASNVPIRFYKDSVFLTAGTIPYIGPNSTASITKTMIFSPEGFYPIKVWIDSSNTLGEVQTLNNYAIRPVIVGDFTLPVSILMTSNTTTFTCNNRVYLSGTALYSESNLVGNSSMLGATVTVIIPGVGTFNTNTITGGFWSLYINSNNISYFNCANSYSYSVTITDYTIAKTINGTPFSFDCVICSVSLPLTPYNYYNYTASNTCPLNNLPFSQTFTLYNYTTTSSYKDTIRVYADNVLAYTYFQDSIGSGQTPSFTSSFTKPTGLVALKYVHKYTNTISGTVFDSSTYHVPVYVEPNLPDFSWRGFVQTGPVSFGISLRNLTCVPAGSNLVYLYDSMPGNTNYTLIDSFAIPPLAMNSSFPINYTRPSWALGYHYLKLGADVYAEVQERDETNNIYLGLVYVPLPELIGVITGVSNPSITGGTVVNFTGTINNSGSNAANFKAQFLVDNIPLGNKISISGLASNSNVNVVSPLYTIPADSCARTITLKTDVDNEVAELNETNNTFHFILGIDILQPPYPTYRLAGNSQFDHFVFQKDVPGNFYGWALNSGTRNAAGVRLKFTFNGIVLGYDNMISLNAGEVKKSVNINYTFTSSGWKLIRVDYDYNNELCEYNESNNAGFIYVYVYHDLPNLRILSQHISPSLLNPNPGQSLSVVASAFNAGSGIAAPSKMRFYYNDGLGYVQLGSDVQVNSLLPGRDTTVAATATLAPGSVGLKIIKVKIDALDQIIESNETDNEATRSIIAGAAPDFARSIHEGITINPNNFVFGDSVTVRNYIRNYGGAAGTAWMRIFIKDELHQIVSLDSVQFNINGVDSSLIGKKIKINADRGYIVTEIVNSNPQEYNIFNNTDSLNFETLCIQTLSICPPDLTTCINANPFSLTGGAPTGGFYSGIGVSNGKFNPAAAGVGAHTIRYSYINMTTGSADCCTFSITVNAAPSNDDAAGATLLTIGASCTGSPFTNYCAYQSTGEPFPACQGTAGYNSVWFKFTAPPSGNILASADFNNSIMGNDSRLALYSAGNVNNYATFTSIACGIFVNDRCLLYATGLTPGITYYLQLDGKNESTATGTFCLKVDELISSMLSAATSCTASEPLATVNDNYTGWMPVTDASGNLIALIKNLSGGATTSTYTSGLNIHPGPVRQDPVSLQHYLNRNFFINNPGVSNVNVRFFFLNSEIAALQAADLGVRLSNLQVTRQTGTGCENNFVAANGANSSSAQISYGTGIGFNWTEVISPGFSKFYLHTKKAFLPVKTFLHGAYNSTLSRHKNVTTIWAGVLNANVLNQPYHVAPFSYTGKESVSPGFFTSTTESTDIVDWVLLELRDAFIPTTVISRRVAFIREDGRITDLDGVTDVSFRTVADGNYYLVIRHRNHLNIRTATVRVLNGGLGFSMPTLYNFSSAQTQAYQNGVITSNAAMKEFPGSVFGLWGGNGNGDGSVRATGLPAINDYLFLINTMGGNATSILSNVYNNADMNMDGQVRATGLPVQNDYIFLIETVLGLDATKVIVQHQ